MGAFDHLEWTYDGAFEQLFGLGRGEFEQKFSENSNARGVARGGMLKLRFDWYISHLYQFDGLLRSLHSDFQRTHQHTPVAISSPEFFEARIVRTK